MEVVVKGKRFSTIAEACKQLNQPITTYYRYRKQGMDLETALTYKGLSYKPSDESTRTDHTGRVFKTKRDMVRHYGIAYNTFDARIAKGWTLEEALTGTHVEYTCFDHKGNGFSMLKDMLAHYNVSKDTYYSKLSKGYTLEEILMHVNKNIRVPEESRTDHEGRVWDRIDEMCEYWGVTTSMFYERRNKHWPMEQCLLGKGSEHRVISVEDRTDPFGHTFESISDMCKTYGISQACYYNRTQKFGFNKVEALSIVPRLTISTSNQEVNSHLYIEGFACERDGQLYFACILDDNEEVLSKKEIEQIVIQYFSKVQ